MKLSVYTLSGIVSVQRKLILLQEQKNLVILFESFFVPILQQSMPQELPGGLFKEDMMCQFQKLFQDTANRL